MASMKERWSDYRPSKGAVVWSFVGGIVLTLFFGFAVFDWYTAGSARAMAEQEREEGRAQLAATLCVEHFMAAPDLRTRLVALQEENSYSRDSLISDAGWTTFGDMEEPVDEAAELCAEQLAEMEIPEASEQPAAEPAAAEPVNTDTQTDEQDS